jgi:hypothetical protein
MNWKLLLQLSLFGLAMAAGTVSLITEQYEWMFWLVIFIFCAYIIAKRCSRLYFLNGFVLSFINSFWITVVDIIFCSAYLANHPDRRPAQMHIPPALAIHPRLMLLLTGVVSGIIFGLLMGLFAFVASKILKKGPAVADV